MRRRDAWIGVNISPSYRAGEGGIRLVGIGLCIVNVFLSLCVDSLSVIKAVSNGFSFDVGDLNLDVLSGCVSLSVSVKLF